VKTDRTQIATSTAQPYRGSLMGYRA